MVPPNKQVGITQEIRLDVCDQLDAYLPVGEQLLIDTQPVARVWQPGKETEPSANISHSF